ncbi:MAG TPA: hypothetical protein VF131_00380 [Blastocatellia bacterium]|nr:hypothetical protein [Blastocatellia bacterium]
MSSNGEPERPERHEGCEANRVHARGISITEHIPPVGITGGSLQIEVKDELFRQQGTASRPHNRVATNIGDHEQYLAIFRVWVITEVVRQIGQAFPARFTDYFYLLPRHLNAQLRLWLQRLNPDEPLNTNREPDVIIRGGFEISGPRQTLSIEIDQDLELRPRHSPTRPKKYTRGVPDREFRIGKWAITDPVGNVIQDQHGNNMEAQGDDNYIFQVAFYDIHP